MLAFPPLYLLNFSHSIVQISCVGPALSISERNVGGEGETVAPPLQVLPHLLHGCLVPGLVHEADPHVGCAAFFSTGILILLIIKWTRQPWSR